MLRAARAACVCAHAREELVRGRRAARASRFFAFKKSARRAFRVGAPHLAAAGAAGATAGAGASSGVGGVTLVAPLSLSTAERATRRRAREKTKSDLVTTSVVGRACDWHLDAAGAATGVAVAFAAVSPVPFLSWALDAALHEKKPKSDRYDVGRSARACGLDLDAAGAAASSACASFGCRRWELGVAQPGPRRRAQARDESRRRSDQRGAVAADLAAHSTGARRARARAPARASAAQTQRLTAVAPTRRSSELALPRFCKARAHDTRLGARRRETARVSPRRRPSAPGSAVGPRTRSSRSRTAAGRRRRTDSRTPRWQWQSVWPRSRASSRECRRFCRPTRAAGPSTLSDERGPTRAVRLCGRARGHTSSRSRRGVARRARARVGWGRRRVADGGRRRASESAGSTGAARSPPLVVGRRA